MRGSYLLVLLLLGCSVLPSAQILSTPAYYPEGPVLHNNALYFVEYAKHRVRRQLTEGASVSVFYQAKGCGPAGLIIISPKKFVVSCYDNNELHVIDDNGQLLQILKHPELIGPNDFSLSPIGFYVSASGVFDITKKQQGKIFHYDEKNGLQVLLKGLNYPNGLALVGEFLYVAEHFDNSVSVFKVSSNSERSAKVSENFLLHKSHSFKLLPLPDGASNPYLGPDGLKFNPQRNSLFVAQYGGGRVFELNLVGEILKTYELLEQYPTNIAFDSDGKYFFVTAMKDANTEPYIGEILKLAF